MSLIATGVPVTQGTWTPSIGGTATYTIQSGTYTRIGTRVFFEGRLAINTVGTGSVSTISGLPFTAAQSAAATVGFWAGSATSYVSLTGQIGGATIILRAIAAAGAALGSATFFANSADIIFSGCYTV